MNEVKDAAPDSVKDWLDGKKDQQARTIRLAQAEKQWRDFATPERGFFVTPESGVSGALRGRYELTRAKYVRGEAELRDVHEAFSDWARSTRRNHFVRQLEGSAFDPIAKNDQMEIQGRFRAGEVERVIRKCVTPQVDPQPDQLARMRLYFGVEPYEYAVRRVDTER